MAGVLSIFSVIPVVTMAFYLLLLRKRTVKQFIMVSLLFDSLAITGTQQPRKTKTKILT
ncbi:MAG: hypothetical protein IJ833_05860 [Lachnospiraceae bacterium]|nr:hypothetical protein [Lachnospiraceae bacterium]